MSDGTEKLRALHAKYLDRKPVLTDLAEELQAIAEACRVDEHQPLCRWGRDKLSTDEWERIRAAEAEMERRKAEVTEMLAACQRRDEAALRSMYPGCFAFYEMVASPPAFDERPRDAVVVIGISGNLVRKAKKLLERGMAREALNVQYGGPKLRDYSPNKYAARSNTENFFHGYYTPEIEARMETPRLHCERLRNSRFRQAACRRDISVSIVRDWLVARQHSSVRFLVTDQSSWPEYALLLDRYLSEFDTSIDTDFDSRLPRDSSFLLEMCAFRRSPELWLNYEFYVNTLIPDRFGTTERQAATAPYLGRWEAVEIQLSRGADAFPAAWIELQRDLSFQAADNASGPVVVGRWMPPNPDSPWPYTGWVMGPTFNAIWEFHLDGGQLELRTPKRMHHRISRIVLQRQRRE